MPPVSSTPPRLWLRSFTRGRWHVVVEAAAGTQRAGQLLTLCSIPVPDYEHGNVRDGFTPAGFGCIDCHIRLGCRHGHELGWCPDTCACPCADSLVVERTCGDCYFPGPLRGERGNAGLLYSSCPRCGACAGPHRERDL